MSGLADRFNLVACRQHFLAESSEFITKDSETSILQILVKKLVTI